MRKNMWALLALMNYFDTEATEHNDPDTPAENEHDESASDHGDSAGNGNPNSNAEPSTPTTAQTTSTPSGPAGETRSPAMLKAIRLIANAVAQGAALTATTSIVVGEMMSYGISQTVNYLWIRDQDNRTDSFGFFGIACKNPFTGMCYSRSLSRSTLMHLAHTRIHTPRTGAAPTTAMPALNTLDRRQNAAVHWRLTEQRDVDPNNDFDMTTIIRIVDDTNQRHNREAPHRNVGTLVANAYNKLCIATSNLAA